MAEKGRHKLSTLRHVEFKNLLGDKFCTTSTSTSTSTPRRQQRRTVCDVYVDAVRTVVVVVVVLLVVVVAAFVY